MANEILEAALDYAKHGIPVFPVNPLDKHPLCEHGFKDATTNASQIETWWQHNPNAMIGIPTGEASGYWVLDADVDPVKGLDGLAELEKLQAQNGALPETLTSITPRGGKHFYFRWSPGIRNSTSKIAPGLDVRGTGGYVILPPSMRADGKIYQWCGNTKQVADALNWLLEQVSKKKQKERAKSNGSGNGQSRAVAWAQTALENECHLVANAAAGTRNDQLNRSAFNLFQLVAGGHLDEQEVRERLLQAAEACGLVNDDGAQSVEATIDSGGQAGRAQPRSHPPQQQIGGSQSQARPQSRQQAQPQPAPQQPQPQPQPAARLVRPIIYLVEGELPRAVDEAEAALIANGQRHIYQRGDLLVRPIKPKLKAADDRETVGWQLVPITKPYMIDTFTRIARFERFDTRFNKYVAKNCPGQVAELFISRGGQWKVPVLLSIVNAPFLRRDGSLCDRPGYDQISALLFNPERQTFPTIPVSPTREDARAALKYLDETLLEEFPFVQKIDRSVALSGILTALDRRAMATAPLHAFTSPVAGTGKSLLVDLASTLTNGQLAPVISQGQTEEELEKRLGATLIAGDQIVSLDNCDREISSPFLCQALTQQRLRIRLLGLSRHVDVPITATFFVTGNNLVIADDLTRRTLLCQLDAGVERPELRKFKRNVLEVARAQRGALVAAALIVLRAWHGAQHSASKPEPLGSFEEWSFRIREPLLWLDRIDPCESIATVRESDPNRSLLITVLEQWKLCLGVAKQHTIKQIIDRATVDPDFFNALVEVASTNQGTISNQRLGRWLNKNEGKIANRLKLIRVGVTHGFPLWQVSNV
jgi:Bifunctional DNA primase/polymerase, N-terminal